MQGLNANGNGCGASIMHTYIGWVNCGVRCIRWAGVLWTWVVYPSEAKWGMKARVTLALMYHSCAKRCLSENSLIGLLTRRRHGLGRKWCDVIIGPIGGGYPLGKPMGGHKRRNWAYWSCITCKMLSGWRAWHHLSSIRYTGSALVIPMTWLSNPPGIGSLPSI